MLYDIDRLAVLSGISDSNSNLLVEAHHEEADVNELQNLRAQEDADANSPRADLEPNERPELEESRLRKVIRKEIAAMLREMQEADDLQSIQAARQTKSVGVAMGIHGFGFKKRRGQNRAAANGPGRSQAFGGPGFM
jgi:hypothetical protein